MKSMHIMAVFLLGMAGSMAAANGKNKYTGYGASSAASSTIKNQPMKVTTSSGGLQVQSLEEKELSDARQLANESAAMLDTGVEALSAGSTISGTADATAAAYEEWDQPVEMRSRSGATTTSSYSSYTPTVE